MNPGVILPIDDGIGVGLLKVLLCCEGIGLDTKECLL